MKLIVSQMINKIWFSNFPREIVNLYELLQIYYWVSVAH